MADNEKAYHEIVANTTCEFVNIDANVVQVQMSFTKIKTQNYFFSIFILNSSTLILVISQNFP
jgi:hypothetical protein